MVRGAAKSFKNLVFTWVQGSVDSCYESGSRTALNFDSWAATVRAVQEVVTDVNCEPSGRQRITRMRSLRLAYRCEGKQSRGY